MGLGHVERRKLSLGILEIYVGTLTSGTIAGGENKDMVKVTITGGRSYLVGFSMVIRGVNVNERPKNLELRKKIDGRPYVDFLNPYAGHIELHLKGRTREIAEGTYISPSFPVITGTFDVIYWIEPDPATRLLVAFEYRDTMYGGFGSLFNSELILNIDNREPAGTLPIEVTSMLLYLLFEEGISVSVTVNPT